jgi:glycosyltransferase involved in cell wall biosynthesis
MADAGNGVTGNGRPVEVLHVLGSAREHGMALAQIVANLARHVDRDRYRTVVWFTIDDGPLVRLLREAGTDVRVVRWRGGALDPVGAFRFWRALRRSSVSIVHQHSGGRSIRALVRAATDARVVLHVHAISPESPVLGDGERNASGADLVIANSRATAATVGGVPVEVIHPSVEAGDDSWTHPERRERNPIIGVACRLVPVKGLIDLLSAFKMILGGFPDARLHIAGSGPEDSRLRAAAEEYGIRDSVVFLGWRQNIRADMRRWDVYAQSSLEEGFGLAVLDAMAAGLPVVATNVGGIGEVVIEGETGFLVPAGNPQLMAERLQQLLSERDTRKRMGEAGRLRALRVFSPAREAAAVQAAYDRLLG